MTETVYATFSDLSLAERAVGALMDFGVRAEDISVVAKDESAAAGTRDFAAHTATLDERAAGSVPVDTEDAWSSGHAGTIENRDFGNQYGEARGAGAARIENIASPSNPASAYEAAADAEVANAEPAYDVAPGRVDSTYTESAYGTDDPVRRAEESAKTGISTTTPGDAAAGAAKGAVIGLGVGALAAISSILVPGFGLVAGGGALATALGGAVGTTAAGAVAGGVHGYLKDQGVPDEAIAHYETAYRDGGAIVGVQIPSNDVGRATVEDVLAKYHANNVRLAA